MISSFIDALINYSFLQRALLTSVLVGLICGLIGCFIILRGMSLMGDAISHAVLPGVAISYMLGISFLFGAVFTGILTALLIGFVVNNSRIKNDSAIGIVFSAAFALGVILISKVETSTDLNSILFGNVLAVRRTDMLITLVIGVLVIAFVLIFYKQLLVTTFDPIFAETIGLNNQAIHYSLMVVLTLVTVASLQTVGVILVVAMLITPAATAYLLSNQLSTMLFLSVGFGVLSAIVGMFFSYTYNLASGATIVLVATFIFVLIFFTAPKQGLLKRVLKR